MKVFFTAESLVTRGLLPENLPPVFTSDNLWSPYAGYTDGYIVERDTRGVTCPYNASKRGRQRRVFGLPHPTFVRDQAEFFLKHWPVIEGRFSKSPGSLSKPTPWGWPRPIRITPHSELPTKRLQAFSRYKFCAVADVSRFFPSIYTHTIPWAIHGREEAKRERRVNSSSITGNRLDFITRQGQDAQTIGIPVGPDTSKISSEIILSAVDEHFLANCSAKNPTYLRHVDDYWIGGDTIEQCEIHIQGLRAALHYYELDLNDLKTKIVTTNLVFGESWPTEFEKEIVEALYSRNSSIATVATLSKIVDRATRENDDGMIRHVIRKIDERSLWRQNWAVLEHFLAQCAVQFSHSFDYVARVVAWANRTNFDVDRNLWIEVAKTVAAHSASLGRDSEVVWSLWLLKELDCKLPKALTNTIVAQNSPITLALLAHFYAKGLTNDRKLKTVLWEAVQGDRYAGKSWPLSLELDHLGISPFSQRGSDSNRDELRLLHKAGVSIINWEAVSRVFEEGNEDPDHAIEDFTSDYDNDRTSRDDDDQSDSVQDFFDDLPI